jgi:alpha-glucosidase
LRAADSFTLTSPDGSNTAVVALKSLGQPYPPGPRLYYRVLKNGQLVLADSPLGLDFKGASALDRDFEVVGSKTDSRDSTWDFAFGARSRNRDHYHQITVSLRERAGARRRMDVIFRAYNEGVAFRYVLPEQDGLKDFVLSSENTEFHFARDASAFAIDLGGYATAYESEYPRISLSDIKPTSIIGLPLLVQLSGGPWVALLEADLRNYGGMYVGAVPHVPNGLAAKISRIPDFDPLVLGGYSGTIVTERDLDLSIAKSAETIRMNPERTLVRSDELVVGKPPFATPWRVVMMHDRPGGLIENNHLILSLSSPSVIADTSWIQPGKSAWNWWSGGLARNVNFTPGMNTATMKHYIDFAAEHHLEYMLIDGGWSPFHEITKTIPEINMPEIMAHARKRGVKIILWVFWPTLRKQIDEAFALYEKWGVAGVKIDFMDRDDQEMVKDYEVMMQKAARHRLIVNFHGTHKPTGLRRTYPNLLNREGVLGMEFSRGTKRDDPVHHVTLPFTRMLAGPMDYTPGCFHNATRAEFQPRFPEPMCQGTRAHQLAMYVVYEMPLAMVSDFPEALAGRPGMEFIEQVPTVWDDTKVLNGTPAEFVTIARRHGGTWYIGSMTNWDPRDLEIDLSFLDAGEYEVKIFADGADADRVATSLDISTKRLTSRDRLKIHLASGGGWAAILKPL